MNKIKEFFKIVFENKKTKIMFCCAFMSLVLLITVTFAWFISIIDLPTSQITTGHLSVVTKGYNGNGEFISTIINDEDYDENTIDPDIINVNYPLFEIDNWNSNSATTCYISIENSGTVDVDFALTFTVNGTTEDLQNMGGFWYKIERLNNAHLNYSLATDKNGNKLEVGYEPKSAFYDEVIKDYILKSSKIVLCGDNCISSSGEYSHVCTEYSTLSRNLVTLSHLSEYGTLSLEGQKRCIYRIDLGFRKDAISDRYANVKLDINGSVYATQVGAILDPDGIGEVFTVTDEKSLIKAIENALPGDTIRLGDKVIYNGDLIINKCININTYGNDLVVNGNFVYNYVSDHVLKLNLSAGGNIYVNNNGVAGGNFDLITPNSEVVFLGNNYKTNVYVEGEATFNATNAPGTKGLHLSGANILNKVGDPKDIDIAENTRLTLDYGASLSYVEAVSNATNIEIINYGTIDTINLVKMLLIDKFPGNESVDTEYAQIFIDNYNTINKAVHLPDWSRPFYDYENESGNKEGNTVVIREWGASEMSILEKTSDTEEHFKTRDIIDYNVKEATVVQEVPGKNDSLIVYFGNKDGQETTIQSLLIEYFEEYYDTTGLIINDYINQVKRLVVHSIDKKMVMHTDLSFLKSMDGLQDLDLFKTYIERNEIPKNCFKDKLSLKNVVLPETLLTISASAFENTGLKIITIPSSVTSWDYTALNGITYVCFDSLIPVVPTDLNNYKNKLYKSQYLLVEETAVDEYVELYGTNRHQWYSIPDVYSNYRIFPKGTITDDGQHVVRETRGGYELVCYTGTSNDIVAGQNLYVDGNKINVVSIGSYCYTNVPVTFNLSFSETVIRINERAFFCSNVRTIDFANVQYIDELAFFNCNKITELNTKKVQEIGYAAFHGCDYIFTIECPELLILRSYAFHAGTFTAELSFDKIELIETNGIYTGANNGQDNINPLRMYFNNDSFMGVTYANCVIYSNIRLKVFVKPELVEEFRGTAFVTDKLVYPIGRIIGEYYIERVASIDDEEIVMRLNLGEYVISNDEDNVKLICYNKVEITEDFTVPSTATYIDGSGNEITKTITSIGSYAFNKVKIENIKFTFGENIKTIDTYMFGGHEDNGRYNKINILDFNNVENIGSYACYKMTYLTEITGKNIQIIDKYAFYGCSKLLIANIPTAKIIYDYAFQACSQLCTLNLDSLEELYGYAFDQCKKLFVVNLPSIKKIQGSYPFGSCSDLVSLTLGPNLELLDSLYLLSDSNTRMRELIFEGNYVLTKNNLIHPNIYSSNKNFRIFVPKETINLHYSDYRKALRENGERAESYVVTNSDETLTFDLGKYIITDVEIDGIQGVSISAFNFKIAEIEKNYKLPSVINGKPVIRLGHRSFSFLDFELIDSSSSISGENFAFHDNLLEVGPYAFYQANLRVSDFKNIKYIDSYAFYNCTNIYMVLAPKLTYIGSYGFESCTNIYNFDAPNLYQIDYRALYNLSKLINLNTNIQVAADISWLTVHRKGFTIFAADPGSTLTGINYSGAYHGHLKLVNPVMAKNFNDASSMLMNMEEILLTDEFYYQIFDPNGVEIYSFKTYRYAVNVVGDEVTIIKCLFAYTEDDEFIIPGILDNRTVTTLGTNSFTYRTELKDKTIVFADSITKIGNTVFQGVPLTGVLNLNNVNYVGSQAITGTNLESIIGKKVTTLGSHGFFNNANLVSLYLNSLSNLPQNITVSCPKLKYIYTDNVIKFSSYDQRMPITGITFVMNAEVQSASQVSLTGWSYYNGITIYVPYTSLEYYKAAFSDTSKYVNFNILPIGTIASVNNAVTGTEDLFILIEATGSYDYTTETYERIYELLTVVTQNADIIIPAEWEASDGTDTMLPITNIHKDALKGQPTILNITLPKYLQKFNDSTFTIAESLKNIYVDDENPYYVSNNGVLYTKNYEELVCYPMYHEGTDYTIHARTKLIRSYAFKNCEYLRNVVVGSYLEVVGVKAFEGTELKTIKFNSLYPPISTGEEIFNLENVDLLVYVPAIAINDYKSNSAFAYLQLIGFN